jgi:hypothetical protein
MDAARTEDAGEIWSIARFHIKGRLQCVA